MPIDPLIAQGVQPVNVAQITQQVQQLSNQRLQAQAAQQQLQAGQLSLKQQLKAYQDGEAMSAAYRSASTIAPDGSVKIDSNKLYGILAQGGQGELIPKLQQQDIAIKQAVAKMTKDQQGNVEQQMKIVGSASQAILQQPPEQRPAAYQKTLQSLQAQGIPTNDLPQQYDEGVVLQHAHQAQTVSDQITAQQKEQAAKETAQHNRNTEAQAAATLAQTGERDANTKAYQDARIKAQNRATSMQNEGMNLTPESLDQIATMFATTGQLPPMGMGKGGAAVRVKVMNRAAEMFPGGDLATNKAVFNANKTSLTKIQGQLDNITAFEGTASKNLDLFLDQAKNVVDSGSPLLNTPLRMLQGKVVGSANQAAYDAARQVAVNEIAKVTSNPTLAGSLSDSARHEVDAFNPANATLAQTYKVAQILKQDMKNRRDELTSTRDAINQRIGGGAGASTAANGGAQGGASKPLTITLPSGKVVKID